jgi:hypothetical protein
MTYQAADYFRAVFDWNLSTLSEGVAFCLWFGLAEGVDANYGQRHVPLLTREGKPKPGYYASGSDMDLESLDPAQRQSLIDSPTHKNPPVAEFCPTLGFVASTIADDEQRYVLNPRDLTLLVTPHITLQLNDGQKWSRPTV